MLTKRIIPCLDVRNGRVVKGKKFKDIVDVDSTEVLGKFYSDSGADELVFYDITASNEERKTSLEFVSKVAENISIPFCVGGGVSSIDDFTNILRQGADKVSINSSAVLNPNLIKEAAEKFGDQCVVLSMDVKRVDGKFRLFAKGGREDTGIDALEWAQMGEQNGAGELVVNSIDTDGVKDGFDLEMLQAAADRVSIPIIASGGSGKMEDFSKLFHSIPKVDAGLAASIFHFKEIAIQDLKQHLRENGVEVRMV